jgi:hypothetical protein|tara:strand:- start:166 stop:336 length:171 start_codon:yes stop_codon:yes gene_type:complete
MAAPKIDDVLRASKCEIRAAADAKLKNKTQCLQTEAAPASNRNSDCELTILPNEMA